MTLKIILRKDSSSGSVLFMLESGEEPLSQEGSGEE